MVRNESRLALAEELPLGPSQHRIMKPIILMERSLVSVGTGTHVHISTHRRNQNGKNSSLKQNENVKIGVKTLHQPVGKRGHPLPVHRIPPRPLTDK